MKTMNTGDVTRRIGLTITVDLLTSLGFESVGKDKRAHLWDEAEFPAMCEAIGDWVREKKHAKPVPKPVKAVAPVAAQGDDDDDL